MRRGLALFSTLLAAFVLAGHAGAGTARPPVAGQTLDDRRLSLADLRGKPVVMNVWSSW